MADSYINADNAQALLVDDGINCNSGLAGATVADDQLTLATSDGNQCVDTFNTSLQRGINGFTICDTMCRGFNRTVFSCNDFAFAVDRSADSANYTTQQAFAYRNFHDAAGTANYVAFLNLGFAAHQYDTNGVRVQVQNHAGYVVGQFYQFASHCVFHTDNGCDAVTDLLNDTNLFEISVHFVILQLSAESITHSFGLGVFVDVDAAEGNFHLLQLTSSGSIKYLIANLYDDAAENGGVNLLVQEDFTAQLLSQNCRNGLILVNSQFLSCSNVYI